MKLINIARIKIVAINVRFSRGGSYFKCMKNNKTNDALIEAISRITQILKAPRSTWDEKTVIPVRIYKQPSTNRSLP